MPISKQLLEQIKHHRAKKILLQIPEGLKTRALGFVQELEKRGVEVIIYCDPCFGACDLRDKEAKILGCDLLLHVGHANFGLKPAVPVIYEEFKIEFNPIALLKGNLDKLKQYKKISLVTTLQFLSALKSAKAVLQKAGKKVFIGQPIKAKHQGQVLGCDYSAALPLKGLVDCFLFLGSGRFHPLGLAIRTAKPVLFLDFERGELIDLRAEKAKLARIKAAQIFKAKEAKVFGILISTKPGQLRLKSVQQTKKRLLAKGKTVFIIAMDEITPDKLLGLKLDCLINCACPRLSDDVAAFKKPILNPEDIPSI